MAFRLPRLPVNWREQPQLFERYWDETLTSLEKTLNAILDIPAIRAAVAEAHAAAMTAQAAAATAQTAAHSAQNTADAQASEASLVNSYTSVTSGSLITADSSGSVTIATHTRTYGNSTLNPPVTVNGATISTTAVADDVVRVYYSDPVRAGGSVTYLYTIDPATSPAQSGNTHVAGAVIIPRTGTKPGKSMNKPGYIDEVLLQ